MEDHKIRALLDKYWEGETSLEEEQNLRSYFASSHVAEEFLPFTPLFNYYQEAQHVKMKGEIKSPELPRISGKTVSLRWIINVAASMIIFIAMFFVNRHSKTPAIDQYAYQDTYEDPQAAYDEVKRALLFVSTKMNKGVNTATYSLEKMQPLGEILN